MPRIRPSPLPLAVLALLASATAQEWQSLVGPATFARNVAFDRGRDRVVAFGGPRGDVFELENGAWSIRQAAGPAPRTEPVLVYDEAREHVLMVGGVGPGSAVLDDTWAWDGESWTDLPSTARPPGATRRAVAAYDAARQRVVLFFAGTYEHDGQQWVQRSYLGGPPVLDEKLMVHDRARGVTVLIAQSGDHSQPAATFEWDGTNWFLRSPSTRPLSRTGAFLVYDEQRQRTVMLGGERRVGFSLVQPSEVWEWSGLDWSLVSTNGPQRSGYGSWFDDATNRVVLVGGRELVGGDFVGRTDAIAWDGAAVIRVAPDFRPEGRTQAWFRDPISSRDIFVDRLEAGAQSTAVTWAFDGNRWSRLQPATSPPGRVSPSTTFDASRGVTLLFGGARGSATGTPSDELWAWDGSDWSAVPVSPRPPARHSASMCFDQARGVAVLFGGRGGTPSIFPRDDTWEWNGAAWTQRTSTLVPQARHDAGMAYDPVRGRAVLHGGRVGNVHLPPDPTWEWDGSQWTTVATPAGPPTFSTLVYDATRLAVVAVGTPAASQRAETWSFDGASWQLLHRAASTGAVGMVLHDETRGVLRGLLEQWDLGTALFEQSATPAATAPYGSGCGNPAPGIWARGRARLGEAGFAVETRTVPTSVCGIGLAFVQRTPPTGCDLHIGPLAASRILVADGRGLAAMALPIPALLGLRGLTIFGQAAAIDPVTGNVTLSHGLQITVGD